MNQSVSVTAYRQLKLLPHEMRDRAFLEMHRKVCAYVRYF
jgi:hypothetical protein